MSLDIEYDLFRSSTGLIDFVIIESEFLRFAEYGTALSRFSKRRLANAMKREKDGDDPYSEESLNWKENVEVLTPTLSLVALYMLSEKCLKNLCYSFTEGSANYEVGAGERFKIKTRNGESIFDAQMRYLMEGCNFKFEVDSNEKELLELCRRLRNDFAHGDWLSVKHAIEKVTFGVALRVMSSIFSKIENGMPDRSWIR